MMRMVPAEIPTEYGLMVPRLWAYASNRSTTSGGADGKRRPSPSRSCCTMRIVAMALVKPVTTGKGMNLMAPPARARPRPIRNSPAINVATISPSTPYFSTMP